MKKKFLIGGVIALAIAFSGQLGNGDFLGIKTAFGYGGGGGGSSYTPTVTAINYPLTLTAGQEGTLTQSFSNGLTAKLTVSSNFTSSGGSTTFKIASSANSSALGGAYFDISASDQNGTRVRDFSNNLSITLSGLSLPANVADLGVYYLNETTGEWVLVPGAFFNPATGAVTFSVNHLTKFAVLVKSNANVAVVPPVIEVPATPNFVLSEKGLVVKVNQALVNRLAGRILLQVDLHGEAWYVNPAGGLKYFLGRPADAFAVMRKLGLGISEANYTAFAKGTAPARLSGRILLRVGAHGEAYYVNPLDLKLYYMGRPADAFALMRRFGLGVSNSNLRQISVGLVQ